jgi:membrane-associated phospholipid phosphatase
MTSGLLPFDLVIAAYNVALACVWAAASPRSAVAPWLAAAHVGAAALPWFLRHARTSPALPRVVLREGYPLLALGVFWAELGLLHRLRQIPTHDLLVAAWDRALFGVHLHLAWPAAMPQRWLDEGMHFAYFAYYLLLIVPIAVGLMRRREAFRDLMLRMMATYLVCFAFYTVFPVYGPHSTPGAPHTGTPGFFETLIRHAHQAGDSPGTAFPSSHVAGVVAIAWFAWLWLPRGQAWILTVLAALVTVGTVYTGNHFALDALVGVLWGVVAQTVLVPALRRLVERVPEGAAAIA